MVDDTFSKRPRPKYAKYWEHELDERGRLRPEVVITEEAMETMLKTKLQENKYPDDNPKTSIGASKVPLHLVPPATSYHAAMAFEDGARKYGAYNWRDKTVSTSVYVGAALRHLNAYWDGENESKDAHVHHLGHVIACCGILLDAMSIGKLNDDRPTAGAAGTLQEEYNNKKKEVNERQIFANSLPTGDRPVKVFPMEGRLGATGELGRDSGTLYSKCSGSKGYRPEPSQ